MESVKGDKDKMAQLIRNERRIELCFENKRFWDIRRWKMPLDEKAKGMQIEKAGESLNYKVIEVENRNYKDYMYYGPIPYSEMLKWSNLQQNKHLHYQFPLHRGHELLLSHHRNYRHYRPCLSVPKHH